MIEWRDDLATGFDEIDVQHKTLIKLINGLKQTVEDKQTVDRVKVWEMLQFLEGYAGIHFDREEECMKKTQCPVAEENIKGHKQFMEKFHELQDRFDNETDLSALLQEIFDMASDWIMNHICKTDVELKKVAVGS